MNPSLLFMIRLSGSVKFFWALASGTSEGGVALRLGLPLLGLVLFSLCPALGFGCGLGLRFQFGLGFFDLFDAPLLVDDPVRHLLPGLVGAVELVLFGIRHVSQPVPLGDISFQFLDP